MAEMARDRGSAARDGRKGGTNSGPRLLTPREIIMIDEALQRAGPNGEVVLTIQKGRLRFIAVTEDLLPDD